MEEIRTEKADRAGMFREMERSNNMRGGPENRLQAAEGGPGRRSGSDGGIGCTPYSCYYWPATALSVSSNKKGL